MTPLIVRHFYSISCCLISTCLFQMVLSPASLSISFTIRMEFSRKIIIITLTPLIRVAETE